LSRLSPVVLVGAVLLFASGFVTHLLYVRWNPSYPPSMADLPRADSVNTEGLGTQSHRVAFVPLAQLAEKTPDVPIIPARDVEQIRSLAGNQARIRGRVFKVGHSAKSNTYFLNFGPSREALTAVIFASAVELFERKKLPPAGFDGKEVEMHGTVKDHPQYGLEVILETPAQIRILQ